MSSLPTPESLASLVTKITETMFGMTFQINGGAESPWGATPAWRVALLPIPGGRPLEVAVASNHAGGQALSCAMFSVPAPDVDDSMINDSLAELANIFAGQVKNALGLDQALGLPRVSTMADINNKDAWRSATLQGGANTVQVWVAVTERRAA